MSQQSQVPETNSKKRGEKDMPWVFDEQMCLILHDLNKCADCKDWSDHYYRTGISNTSNTSFQMACQARDRAIREPLLSKVATLKKEYEEGLQEVAALEQELEELRRELEEVQGEEVAFRDPTSLMPTTRPHQDPRPPPQSSRSH